MYQLVTLRQLPRSGWYNGIFLYLCLRKTYVIPC